jgi:hypothetical protein
VKNMSLSTFKRAVFLIAVGLAVITYPSVIRPAAEGMGHYAGLVWELAVA